MYEWLSALPRNVKLMQVITEDVLVALPQY